MIDKIYISDEIIKYKAYISRDEKYESKFWKRSYEIWEHAKKLIETSNSEFQLCDGILNLKRSLEVRLKLIESIYNLKAIDVNNVSKKKYLEILESYGLAQPFIIKNLLTIRNDIEHRDANPPSIERCKELVDIMWYFLRSTDSVVRNKIEFIEFHKEVDDKIDHQFSIIINFQDDFSSKISGFFPNRMLFFENNENMITIDLTRIFDVTGLIKEQQQITNSPHEMTFLEGRIHINNTNKFDLLKYILCSL